MDNDSKIVFHFEDTPDFTYCKISFLELKLLILIIEGLVSHSSFH